MRAVFVHDNCFFRHSKTDKVYDPGSFPGYVWERYLEHFSEIVIFSRGVFINEVPFGLVETSRNRVSFRLLHEVRSAADYFLKSKLIREEFKALIKPDDVVIIRLPSFIGNVCASFLRKQHQPYVTEVVGCIWDATWNYGNLPSKVLAPFVYYNMKRDVKKSMASIYVTKYFLQSRYPNPSPVTGSASNVQLPLVEDSILQRRDFNGNKPLKLGIIANLGVRYKGFDVAIKALSGIAREGFDFTFQLVGGGDPAYVKKLAREAGIADKIEIVGRLKSGLEIFGFLDSIDLYVHPSRQEGLPRVVVESMSRGCPVLASSVAGTPELLPNEFMHKPGDHNSLEEQLKKVMASSELRAEMGKRNLKAAQAYSSRVLSKARSEFWAQVKYYFLLKKKQ